jgi:hypothetical protein
MLSLIPIIFILKHPYLVGDGKAHSGEYPAAYRRLQTPFKSGLLVGFLVGFMASRPRRASLIFARASLDNPAPLTNESGSSLRIELTKDSLSVP